MLKCSNHRKSITNSWFSFNMMIHHFLPGSLQKSRGVGKQIQTKAKEHPVPVGLERIDEGEDDDS